MGIIAVVISLFEVNELRPLFEEHLKSWLIRVTINLCLDYKKSFFRKNTVPLETFDIPYKQENIDTITYAIKEGAFQISSAKGKSVVVTVLKKTKTRELLHNPANGFTVRIGNRLYAHKKKLDEWLLKQIL